MEIAHLVQMANRIAAFFEAYPDRDEARDGVAQHLRFYWEPRMRRAIYRHLDEAGGDGLEPLVVEALVSARDKLQPVAA